MTIKCPKCSTDNPSDSKYCKECAAPLPFGENSLTSHTKTLNIPFKEMKRGSIFAQRYEIIEVLGKGGMGRVYRVEDTKINEEIALKVIKPEIAEDKKIIERFRSELKIARKIRHKNVCGMYDLGEEDGTYFITMEYISGEDLASFMKRSKQLTVLTAIYLVEQICEGLTEAHRLGIVHRDLKPQNVMVDRKGNAHIMDFGIAREASTSKLTENGDIIGTPNYMSPEQIEGKEIDLRSDLYSLGVMIYEMVTGQVPFKSDSALRVALKHTTETPINPRDLNHQIPESLSRVILKCMEKDKNKRYQRAEEVLSDLVSIEKDIKGDSIISHEEGIDMAAGDSCEYRQSIAVLPFKDMSPQKDQDYFCEGLAEELINALTQVQDLKVAARTSSFSFKGKDEDIRKIGKILNVSTVLEGSVQKSGKRLRITAQLINVSDGYHLWSERFDRSIDDIFTIQDEISMAVMDKLKGKLLEADKNIITKRHTQNKTAYNLFLKGRYFFNRRYQGDMIKAVDFYQRAVNQDPDYALPYVGIADVFNILGQWAYIHPKDAYTRSKVMLQKAMEIDSSLSEIYSSMGFMTMGYEWDFPAARNYLLRSIELNPKNAIAHAWLAEMSATVGNKQEAITAAKQGIECDPLFSLIHAIFGVVLVITGQVEDGREKIDKAISMDPDQPMAYFFQGMMYLVKPAFPKKAIQYLQKPAKFGMVLASGWIGASYALLGQRDKALKILEELDKIEKERYISPIKKLGVNLKPGLKHFRFMKKKYVAPLSRWVVYLALNMQDKALDWLEKSERERDYFFTAVFLLLDQFDFPWSEEIKLNPRYRALKRKIKIE
ncbi:MAG: protein kinase [Candidatus Aminicenantes bacterium]|nr:protein kinase [Candidatus Aminicenantes bacterium]